MDARPRWGRSLPKLDVAGSSPVARSLEARGDPPTIDLLIGYNKANASPTLKLFLSRADELIARVSRKLSDPADRSEGSRAGV